MFLQIMVEADDWQGQMVNPDTEPETHEFCIVIKDSDFHSNGKCVLLVDLVRSGEDCAMNHRTKGWRSSKWKEPIYEFS